MWATKRSVSGVPAPAGKEWCFEFPVGVDCSDPEPRCIWLAVLRNANVRPNRVRVPRRDLLHWRLRRVRIGQVSDILSNVRLSLRVGDGLEIAPLVP